MKKPAASSASHNSAGQSICIFTRPKFTRCTALHAGAVWSLDFPKTAARHEATNRPHHLYYADLMPVG